MSTTHTFRRQHKIHFSECDPAGIVFYPQYFVLFNDLIERWVDTLLPDGYHGVIGARRLGMPTVHLEVDFKAISRFGDQVWLELEVVRLGASRSRWPGAAPAQTASCAWRPRRPS